MKREPMKPLEGLIVRSELTKTTVFPTIREGEIVWSAFIESKIAPNIVLINGGQSHPSRESALYSVMNELSLWISDLTALHEKLTEELEQLYRKQMLKPVLKTVDPERE